MNNGKKFKTAQKRAEAFNRFCISDTMSCDGCVLSEIHDENINQCRFAWLNLEAEEEEKPLPCPFCGGECKLESGNGIFWYDCICGYSSKITSNENEAIAAHNRVAKKCRDGK